MNCFILAAGEAARFEGGYPKQHIEVEGERLIERTYRQFSLFSPQIVTQEPAIGGNSFICPVDKSSTAATVISTRHFWCWNTKNLFLYSDVFYTEEAVRNILFNLYEQRAPVFFTDGVDIFGFTGPSSNNKFESALLETAAKAHDPDGNYGRIWEVYRKLYGIEQWPILPEHNKPGLVFIGDRTQDFDTVQDLKDFNAGKSKNALFNRSQQP